MAERAGLDWSGSSGGLRATVGAPKPCIACSKPALLRAPVSGLPLHKTCAETRPDLAGHWTTRTTASPARGEQLADAAAPF